MACFLVSAAEAAVVTVAAKVMEKKEKQTEEVSVSFDGAHVETAHKIPFSQKMKWLSRLQWGGSALLMFEHIWHGEIVPFFPFLSAMNNPADTAEMLGEMATVGTGMALLTTGVWLAMLGVSSVIEKRALKSAKAVTSEE